MTPKPDAASIDLHTCDAAVSLAFSILGKRWNGMILSTLGSGALSFAALKRGVPGISDAMLSDRLTGLAEVRLLTRSVDAGPPVAVTYALTPQGEQLLPLLEQLGQWAAANLERPAENEPDTTPAEKK
ncbi:helix-turn-helix domain-containing protein [Agreia sp. PsM10]|uniref:winged helix-turn-helix transcriptional regulator n=1 Tax=Agreia sp. PsM10 TaxID=3030533 RepID=UPI00263B4865|nr:helix-turn-helix domain-containing protein [Agreia sp. PsM10]MDN4641086.1 helix-turn-helix domain-containing protein [Agreia sp. PsM10]